MHEYTLFFLGFSKFFMVTSVQNRNTMTHTKNNLNIPPMAEFKEFERRFKSKPRFKYCWFHLKLYQMFQDLSRRLI